TQDYLNCQNAIRPYEATTKTPAQDARPSSPSVRLTLLEVATPMTEIQIRYRIHPSTAPKANRFNQEMSRKRETNPLAGYWPSEFGKFSATTPNGISTASCPTILRQPDSPRLRWLRTFM